MAQTISELPYSAFSEKVYDQSYLAQVPTRGQFELTFRCPLKCTFCYCSPWTTSEYERRELSTVQIKNILSEAARGGCLWMTFSGGDPFLRPDFREIYDHSRSVGIIPTIMASGLILTESWLKHLQEYPPLQIELPFYGPRAETYERISGKKGSYEIALKNIRRLLAAGLAVKLKSKITRQNQTEINELKSFIEDELKLSFQPNFFLYSRLDGTSDHLKDRLTPSEINQRWGLSRASCAENESLDPFDSFDALESEDSRLFRCPAGINSFYINPFGELNLCTYVRSVSYDLKGGSLVEGIKYLRSCLLSQTRKSSSACFQCKIQSSCQNCPGHALVETGDLQGRSDYLCSVNQELRGVRL